MIHFDQSVWQRRAGQARHRDHGESHSCSIPYLVEVGGQTDACGWEEGLDACSEEVIDDAEDE